MITPQWLNERKKGIGGSDAAAVMGISPWKTPLKLWKEKRGELPDEDIRAEPLVYWGNRLEPVVADEYVIRTNRRLRGGQFFRRKDRPWMICNVDRMVIGAKIILEIKTVNQFAFNAKEWGDDGSNVVPVEYYAQAQHNLFVTRRDQCDMPILIGGNDYRCYIIPRDQRWIERYVPISDNFWHSLQNGIKPMAIDCSDLIMEFPRCEVGKTVEANMKAFRAYQRLMRARDRIDKQNKISDRAKFEMQAFMADAETLTFNGATLATWKNSGDKGRRFLPKEIKAEQADAPESNSGRRKKKATNIDDVAPVIPDGDGVPS